MAKKLDRVEKVASDMKGYCVGMPWFGGIIIYEEEGEFKIKVIVSDKTAYDGLDFPEIYQNVSVLVERRDMAIALGEVK